MVIINKKTQIYIYIYTHTKKIKESSQTSKEIQHIKREEIKRRRKERRRTMKTTTTKKQLAYGNKHLSINNYFQHKWTKISNQKTGWQNRFLKMTHLYVAYQRLISGQKTHTK